MKKNCSSLTRRIILIFPFDLLSHYLRCIELAKRYPDHKILFAHSDKYSSFVQRAGYESFEVQHFDSDAVMRCAANFDFSWLNEEDIDRVFLSQLKSIDLYRPQFVIGDTSPTLKMAAEKTGVFYVSLMNSYMSRYYALQRPLPDNHFSRKYLDGFPAPVSKKICSVAERFAFRNVHRPFRKLRKKYILKNTRDYLDEMEGDETLLCDDPDIFPVRSLPANYNIIGPLFYRSDPGAITITEGKPLVCVSMGSTGNWEALSFLCSREFSHLSIITAGDSRQVLNAEHIRAYQFMNFDDVLPSCSALICHGGNGTVYSALKHKVKLFCLTSHFEQEYNAKRLEELNLAKRINSDPFQILKKELCSNADQGNDSGEFFYISGALSS